MTLFKQIRIVLVDAITKLYQHQLEKIDLKKITVEQPKDSSHGDTCSNVAMLLAKPLGKSPKDIATEIANVLSSHKFFTKIDIAEPGFINFTLDPNIFYHELAQIIDNKNYGKSELGKGIKVNLEFVSANPTGPLHIGHLRNAFFGNALANVLTYSGYEVVKEFYVNDAGGQILVLANSCFIRYREICTGVKEEIPEGLYPGDYLIDVANEIHQKYSDSLLQMDEQKSLEIFKDQSVAIILEMIKSNLDLLGINFDVFFSEKSLHDQKQIEKSVAKLQEKGLLYRGILEAPKEKVPDDWESREQLLFKSTLFGDDIDRPLQKSDNSWAYFSGDVAYLDNKISRGFDQLIVVLGADHGGYKTRLKAVCSALSDNKVDIDVKITQLVHFVKNGEAVKMSKRSGNFLLAQEVVDEVGKDVISFMMLTRSNDQTLEFDFEKVKETTKDNPVFYVQYAHARIMSVMRAAKAEFPQIHEKYASKQYDLKLLQEDVVLDFIKKLCSFSRIIELSAIHHEPHRIVFYLIDIAADFHSIWNLGRENSKLRFLSNDQTDLSGAYLALLEAFGNILSSALEIFNVEPIESM